ncbi:MAG: type II toxin-antitoxin system HicA family toxin [Atribacterota bacterium]|nr:type II toxin-antitoxin system HicA family toxin [Atribacterota bacterium]
MQKIPLLSGQEVVKAFIRLGWEVARRRGSHIILVKEGHIATLSVPNHREVARRTFRSIIAKSGLTINEFFNKIR